MLKQAFRKAIRRLGYDVVRFPRPESGSASVVQPAPPPTQASPAANSTAGQKMREAEDANRRETEARVQADHYYYIDIVGSCNLRCPSCAVGNYPGQIPKGVMPLEKYKRIVEKIIAEHPGERLFIDLYGTEHHCDRA